MAVYVDQLRNHPPHRLRAAMREHGTRWCHLFADTPEELMSFAAGIGLEVAWAHRVVGPPWRVHFDLPPPRRAAAVAAGAVELDWRQTGRWLRTKRRDAAARAADGAATGGATGG